MKDIFSLVAQKEDISVRLLKRMMIQLGYPEDRRGEISFAARFRMFQHDCLRR